MNEQKRDALALAIGSANPKTRHVYIDGNDACLVAADKSMPLVDAWLAEAEQRVTDAVEAALRLIAPDHITPMGARQVRAAMEKAEGER